MRHASITSERAIPTLEGTLPILSDYYRNRTDPIEKCANAAESLGFKVFALQHGGWCSSAANAIDTYDIYGPSTDCLSDGEGGGWANQVYQFKSGKQSH